MAIERFGEQSCGRRLADAAGTGKQVRVVQTVVFESIAQSVRNDLLTGYLFECLWPPFSGDYLIAHCEY
jgi:hypothetical protein